MAHTKIKRGVFEKSGKWKPNYKEFVTLKQINSAKGGVGKKYLIAVDESRHNEILRVFDCDEFKA